MKFEDNNYFIINKEKYNEILEDNVENVYLYHFIYVKYIEKENIKFIKIDNINDLDKLKNKNVLVKYYISKIHYFNDCSNDEFEYGEPYYIYDIGYFYIGGFIKNKEEEVKKIKEMFENYNVKYKSMNFPFDDKKYLSLNK